MRNPHPSCHVTYRISPVSPPRNFSSYLVPPTSLPQLCSTSAWVQGCLPWVCELHVAQTLSDNLDIRPLPGPAPGPGPSGCRYRCLDSPEVSPLPQLQRQGWFVCQRSRSLQGILCAAKECSLCQLLSQGLGIAKGRCLTPCEPFSLVPKPALASFQLSPGTQHQPGTYIFAG